MQTIMEQEALSTPEKLEQQLAGNGEVLQKIIASLKKHPPEFAVTIARGSSDHAANFAKYLFELNMQLITASAAPSIVSVYQQNVNMKNALVLGISQSGESPDICSYFTSASRQNAHTLALTNTADSPMARTADHAVEIGAGPEHAVAATKSYILTLTTLVHFVALYNNDRNLLRALRALPEALYQSCRVDWEEAVLELASVRNAYIVARGYGYPIAQEAALKLKETCALHAEAYSSAEVLHGPFALIQKAFPVLILGQNDAAARSTIEVTEKMTHLGARTIFAMPGLTRTVHCRHLLNMPDSLHPVVDPIINIQAFYMMACRLSPLRGCNPDQPDNLMKVTETY